MDPDLQRIVIVVVIGLVIAAVSATLLFLSFRAFGEERGARKPILLAAAALAFILICCIGLFIVSRE